MKMEKGEVYQIRNVLLSGKVIIEGEAELKRCLMPDIGDDCEYWQVWFAEDKYSCPRRVYYVDKVRGVK
jgi:hypothetical protein